MAQQVFPQWSPVVRALDENNNEVLLPFAGIHAQTRDGKDEIIVGAGNMVWTGSMWVPVSNQHRLPVEATLSGRIAQVSASKSASRFGTLAASTEEVLAEVQREAIIHAVLIKYDRDDPGARVMMDLWDGTQFNTLLMSHSPSSHTGRITPSDALYNGLFEVLVNNPPDYVVRLRESMRVAGFRLRVSNILQQNIQIAVSLVWSEV